MKKNDEITFFLYFYIQFITSVFYCFQAAIFKTFLNEINFHSKKAIFLFKNIF